MIQIEVKLGFAADAKAGGLGLLNILGVILLLASTKAPHIHWLPILGRVVGQNAVRMTNTPGKCFKSEGQGFESQCRGHLSGLKLTV